MTKNKRKMRTTSKLLSPLWHRQGSLNKMAAQRSSLQFSGHPGGFFTTRRYYATKLSNFPLNKVIDVSPPPATATKQHVADGEKSDVKHPIFETKTSSTAVKCWNCNIVESAPVPTFSCHSCKVLLEKIGPGDYFQIFSM